MPSRPRRATAADCAVPDREREQNSVRWPAVIEGRRAVNRARRARLDLSVLE